MKKILILLMLCITTPMFAQTNIGIDYYLLGEYQKAKKYFESQTTTNPAQSYYYLGEIAFAEGNMAKAEEYYNKSAAADQGNVLCAVAMAKMKLKSDPKAAEAAFDAISKNYKNNLDIDLAIGRAYLDNGMLDKALSKVASAKKINNGVPEIYILEGDIVLAGGDASKIADAAGKYEMANFYEPGYRLGNMKSAKVYESTNPDVVIESLKEIIENDPGYTPAFFMLSKIHTNRGYYPQAIEIFKTHAPSTSDDIERYARALYFTNNFDEAQNVITGGLQENPDDLVLNRYQLYIYAKTGNHTEGLKLADRFFSLVDPSRYIHLDYTTYATLLKEAKRHDEAMTQYEHAISIDPDTPERYKEASEMAREINNYEKAAEYCKIYIDKKITAFDGPDYPNALVDLNMLGNNYYHAGASIKNNSELAAELMKDNTLIGKMLAFDSGFNAASLANNMEYFKTSYSKYYLTKASSVFSELIERAPESYIGYRFKALSELGLNPDLTTNSVSGDYYEKMIAVINSKDEISGSMSNALIEGYGYLMVYYFKADNNAKAIEYSKKVLELKPEDSNAKNILKELNK